MLTLYRLFLTAYHVRICDSPLCLNSAVFNITAALTATGPRTLNLNQPSTNMHTTEKVNENSFIQQLRDNPLTAVVAYYASCLAAIVKAVKYLKRNALLPGSGSAKS